MNLKSLSEYESIAIQSFKEELKKSFFEDVKSIYLFGSKARGDSNKNSDIDLLVITKTEDWKLGDQIRRVGYELDQNIEFRFSILIMSDFRFQFQKEKKFQFIQNVLNDGIEL